jgi:hypothetical protein
MQPPVKSQLYFTGLWVNNKIVNPSDVGPLKEPINSTSEIRLRYSQNIFAISATMIDFSIGGDKRVFYRLENYDKDWRSTNPEELMQYLKIPPGKYLFRVRIAAGIGEDWQREVLLFLFHHPGGPHGGLIVSMLSCSRHWYYMFIVIKKTA